MIQKQIVIDDHLINYYQTGTQTAAPAVVFLHGWQSNAQAWVGVLNHMDCQALALDLPGFGQSPRPRTDWGVGDYAELVKSFLAKLQLSHVVLVGHSFGGRITIKLAAANPGLVKTLVLVDAAGFRNNSLSRTLKIWSAKILKPLFELGPFKALKPRLYELIGASDYGQAGQLKSILIKTLNEDLSADMRRITVPTVLVWGDEDFVSPLSFAERMHKLIPQSEVKILKNAGHFSFIDQPEQFLAIIQKLT